MDPGPYALCSRDGHCATGVLDPFGSLALTLP
jgi:hypothetical protein